MKNLSGLITSLTKKMERLLEAHANVKEQNARLSDNIVQLKQEIKDKDQQLKELTNKLEVLKISKSVGDESTKETKLKINELVREIDKCIAQISR